MEVKSVNDLEEPTFVGGSWRILDVRGRLVRVGPRSNLIGLVFEGCDFTGVSFAGAAMKRARFVNCTFDSAEIFDVNADGAVFDNCSMRDAKVKETKLSWAIFTGCRFGGATLEQVSLKGSVFVSCTMMGCQFSKCDLSWTRFTGITDSKMSFFHSTLLNSEFDHLAGRGLVAYFGGTFRNVVVRDSHIWVVAKDVDIDECLFENNNMEGSKFITTQILNSSFSKCILDRSYGPNSTILGTTFNRCTMLAAELPRLIGAGNRVMACTFDGPQPMVTDSTGVVRGGSKLRGEESTTTDNNEEDEQ
jgi:uncharacterized protein YjbI with pentapeptide repeats